MAGNYKPPEASPTQDDAVYRVKHISRSAWEEGTLSLPGLTPRVAREEDPEFDDVAMDMAMTGEIPLELIRSMLRKQEELLRAANKTRVKGPTGGGMILPGEIVSAAADFPAAQAEAETPTPEEIERAKDELRAMKSKSRLPQPGETGPEGPQKSKGRKKALPKAIREGKSGELYEEDKEALVGEEEPGGPSLMGTMGLLPRMREGEPGFWDDAVPLYHIPLRGFLRAVYRSLYYYGLRFVRPLRIAYRTVLPILAKPLLTLWYLLRAAVLALHYVTVGRLLRALGAVRATHAKRLAVRKGRRVSLRTMLRGILIDYRPVLRPAANVLKPLMAVVVLLLVVQWLFSSTYALQVKFDGKPLGYVANQSVFEQAQNAAANNIVPRPETAGRLAGDGNAKPEAIKQDIYAQFNIQRVNPEDLISMDVLTNELLSNAKGEPISAYGLRIDGVLFRTIKNKTDADIVLESIKKEKEAELKRKAAEQQGSDFAVSENAIPAFVQNVELVHGFYPAAQLVDAQTLLEDLNRPQMEEQTVKVQPGDTPFSLVADYKLSSVEELYALNPWMTEDGAGLHVDDEVIVREEVTGLEVKIVQIETRLEEVPFETVDTTNDNLFKGEVRISVKGVPGQDKITERVTYINNERVGEPEFVSRATEKEPTKERRELGTKSTVVTLNSGEVVNVRPSAGGFTWPVPACHRISSPYGYRGRSFHKGIDIADGSTSGKIIVAAKSGVVEQIQLGGSSYGNMILINHGGGVKTRYAHIMSGSISVRQGEHVSIGQPIARVGSTGNSTGPHLHFEVLVNGSTQNPRNYVSP